MIGLGRVVLDRYGRGEADVFLALGHWTVALKNRSSVLTKYYRATVLRLAA